MIKRRHFALLMSMSLALLSACGPTRDEDMWLQNDLQTPALSADEQLEAKIRNALSEDEMGKAIRVTISVYRGTVLVTGQVPTPQYLTQVINIVRRVPGVKLVHNQLEVSAVAAPATQAQDSQLASELRARIPTIKSLPGFDPSQVKITVENGVVYWMGGVHQAEGQALTEVARQLPGVKKVVVLFEYVD